MFNWALYWSLKKPLPKPLLWLRGTICGSVVLLFSGLLKPYKERGREGGFHRQHSYMRVVTNSAHLRVLPCETTLAFKKGLPLHNRLVKSIHGLRNLEERAVLGTIPVNSGAHMLPTGTRGRQLNTFVDLVLTTSVHKLCMYWSTSILGQL